MPFLPITKKEMMSLGWKKPDFIIVTGDAYIDHPSFGTAIISRVLEAEGFRVCIISQPQTDKDYTRFGAPRLCSGKQRKYRLYGSSLHRREKAQK